MPPEIRITQWNTSDRSDEKPLKRLSGECEEGEEGEGTEEWGIVAASANGLDELGDNAEHGFKTKPKLLSESQAERGTCEDVPSQRIRYTTRPSGAAASIDPAVEPKS